MRIRCCVAALVLAAGLPGLAQAEPIAGFVDLYYMPSAEIKSQAPDPAEDGETTTGKVDGDGYGVKGLLRVSSRVALDGEYQSADYDGSADRDSWRLGAGYYWRYFGVAASYINEKLDDGVTEFEADGAGVYIRTSWLATDQLAFTGSIGYVRLDDDGRSFDGLEYNAGLDFRIAGGLGAFADYRYTDIEDGDFGLKVGDARVGLRLVF